jgi:calcium/calmodulin-dependent protein kinase (CaM kinase) II
MSTEEQLIELTHQMLKAIQNGDRETYTQLCAPELTAFENDVAPYRIDGVPFHAELIEATTEQYSHLLRFDMLQPSVQVHGNAAVVCYTRLMTFAVDVPPTWRASNETRVFVKKDEGWRMVHFHRTVVGSQ